MRSIFVLVGVGALLFIAARGFGEKAMSVSVLQPAESPTGQLLVSRMVGFKDLVYSISLGIREEGDSSRSGAVPIYVGTRRGLYRSEDDGLTWKKIFSSGMWGGAVQAMALRRKDPSFLLMGAGNSLFASSDGGSHWRRITRFGRSILCVAVDPTDPNRFLVGTEEGLKESRDGGMTWGRVSLGMAAGLARAVIFHSTHSQGCFARTSVGLFQSKDGGLTWQRLWVERSEDSEAAEEPVEPEGKSEEANPLRPLGLAVDPATGAIYLGSFRGLFLYGEAGATGMPILREDLPARAVYAVALERHGKQLWVGMENGLFRIPAPAPPLPGIAPTPQSQSPMPDSQLVSLPLPQEPTVQELQQAAIRYNEVMPEKIQNWRRLAVVRSWVPKFTLELDQDRDRTIASSTSGGKTTFTVGPEDQSVSLGFGFTWDLANFIWNPDQTSIDVRSRLTTQLRQDVLEEVTRLYFERKKLMAEFRGNPTTDPILQEERSLRIEELTAQLDALTGGWFSQRLNGK